MSKKLLQIVWIAAIVLYAVTQVSRLQAQIDHAAIKTLALEAIKKQYVGVVKPSAGFDRDSAYFSLPHAMYVRGWQDDGSDEKQEDLLVSNALHNQLIVEIMRKYPPDALSRRVWRPYLNQIEQLIGQCVQVINSKKKWDKKLGRLNLQISELYNEGQQEYARRRRRPLGRTAPSLSYYDVTFTSGPGGARVWLCHFLDYRMAELQGKKVSWRLVPDPKNIELAGTYAYLLQWGNKSHVGEKAINVDRSGTYFLK